MGRIRLDWDIESQKISKRDGEDPAAKRARRRSILKLLLLIGILIGMIIAAPLLVRQRLLDVQNQVELLLRDTVHAEVAALRIGDLAAFLDIQRSATDEWPNAQRAAFQEYAAMKAEQDLKLTGTILAIAIDGQRGRVLVEEIMNGAPYAKTWFYWRYADGWRHVPPDYTFWGETRRIESDALRIQYRAVDELFAQQLSQTITAWLDHGCGILNCGSPPPMTIDIAADAPPAMSWADESQRRLLMQSPYVHGARADQPFDPPRQLEAAELLAERLMQAQTGGQAATWPHDVFHLRQSVRLYLVEQFAQIDTGAPLIKSLASQYGIDKISQLVSLFAPAADMSIIQRVIPDPIGQGQAGLARLYRLAPKRRRPADRQPRRKRMAEPVRPFARISASGRIRTLPRQSPAPAAPSHRPADANRRRRNSPAADDRANRRGKRLPRPYHPVQPSEHRLETRQLAASYLPMFSA